MLALIDKTLTAMDEGIPMGRSDMFEVFGDFDPAEHEQGQGALGRTEAYQDSARGHAGTPRTTGRASRPRATP